MSIKSLLQLILTLLILLILGGIYYIYFYSNPVKNQINLINQTNNLNKENKTDQEMLDEIPRSENDNKITQNNIEIVNKTNDHIKTESKETKNNNLNNTDSKKLENLTKEIEYITSNKEGDIFKILAKFGKSNIKNSDILDLEYVDGLISSKKRSQIFISSNCSQFSLLIWNVEISEESNPNWSEIILLNSSKLVEESTIMSRRTSSFTFKIILNFNLIRSIII